MQENQFQLRGRKFSSSGKCNMRFKMAEYNPTTTISHHAHVTDTLSQYNMIIARELLRKLGIDWRGVEVSMKKITCTKEGNLSRQRRAVCV